MAEIFTPSADTSLRNSSTCTACTDRSFKGAFKIFKALKGDVLASSKRLGLDLVDSLDPTSWNRLPTIASFPLLNLQKEVAELGLVAADQWDARRLPTCPGGIILRNPFTKDGQRRWIQRTLLDYPPRDDLPSNMDRIWKFAETRNSVKWWSSTSADHQLRPAKRRKTDRITKQNISLTSSPIWKLRWITLGYHHDWDSKLYSEEKKSLFPADLGKLCSLFACYLGCEDFSAEAAIVNYYHLDSTLSPHQDVSEPYQEAPLISISFGQPAVFLIGSEKSEWPTGVILRSGDVFVMSGESRLAYHAVPKVFSDPDLEFGTDGQSNTDTQMLNYLTQSRINVNVRQVLRPGQTTLPDQTAQKNFHAKIPV